MDRRPLFVGLPLGHAVPYVIDGLSPVSGPSHLASSYLQYYPPPHHYQQRQQQTWQQRHWNTMIGVLEPRFVTSSHQDQKFFSMDATLDRVDHWRRTDRESLSRLETSCDVSGEFRNISSSNVYHLVW